MATESDAKGQIQDLPSEENIQVATNASVQNIDMDDQENKNDEEISSEKSKHVSDKIQALRNNKKYAKTRLTKTKKQLNDLIDKQLPGVPLPSKNSIRRAINKVNTEMAIIEKIISGLKEIYAVNAGTDETEETNTVIETLDKELEDIGSSVDKIIVGAEQHLQERLANGEAESVMLSTHSKETSAQSPAKSKQSYLEKKQKEAKEASDKLMQMEQEQKQKEQELEKLTVELQLSKQRTEEARKIAELNKSQAEAAEQNLDEQDNDTIRDFLNSQRAKESLRLPPEDIINERKTAPIRLKGVDLPKFAGEDKSDYESWKAAFMSVVDRLDIPVGEKMLRLLNSLSGKAHLLVKDLGYSAAAYERAKEKLEKKYGGQRRLQIKHLTTLRNWKKVRPRNLEDLEEFQAVLERVSMATKDSGSFQSESLNLAAKEKLAEEDVQSYKHWLLDHSQEDSFESLLEWTELQVQIMEEAKEEIYGLGKRKLNKDDGKNNSREKHRARGFETRSEVRSCIVDKCNQDHPPWVCPMFKELPVSKRKDLIKKTGRCFQCLAAGHHSKDCRRARECGVGGCKSNKHSSYLHDSTPRHPEGNDGAAQQNREQLPDNNQPQTGNVERQHLREGNQLRPGAAVFNQRGPNSQSSQERGHKTGNSDSVSLMVLPAVISNDNRELRVNIMLDPCSTSSYVSESAAEELRLQGQPINLTISGTGGTEITCKSSRVELSVSSIDGSFSSTLQAHVLDDIASDTPAIQWSRIKEKWPHLSEIPFENISKRRQIDVMIGSDHPLFHLALKEVVGGRPSDPIARLTNLGWVCFGPTLVEEFRQDTRTHFTRTFRSNQNKVDQEPPPVDILRQFWELESIGIKEQTDQPMTADDKAAMDQVSETFEFKDGRYELGMPWKDGEPRLDNNFEAAMLRLESQEKSLKRKGPELMQAYSKIFKDYEEKGYIRAVPKSETSDQWFLPHFPIVRPDKDTTKIRAVFDAAMKYNGKSLNDAMRSGPKLQREIVDVLTRFRRAPVALSSDISEMFLQVGIRESDRKYHRFLWRDFHTEREPTVYEFQRLVFGNTAAPFCSQYVIQTHAKEHATEFPEAADSVSNSMYVDDLLDSSETVETAQDLQCQLTTLLASAGFRLRKWASNEAAVVESIPESERLSTLDFSKDGGTKTKTLGVMWEAKDDVFTFQIKCPESSKPSTKRTVLSTIAAIYDPLQFLAPFIIRAKMLMQEMWLAGLDWDHVLPEDLATKWSKWVSELPCLSRLTIPRPLRLADPVGVDMHLFSDASKDAFAAVAYLVSSYQVNEITSRLVASKCRVAPVKSMTIPRLELMGAVLSCRLAQSLLKVLEVDRVFFWTDSENVWYWVHNQSKEFKPFVANRIGEIHRTTSPEQWHHVPGTENPADLATRGMSADELTDCTFWMEGPTFLKQPETAWPAPPSRNPKQVEDHERRARSQTHATNVCGDPVIDPQRFSSFRRLCRVTAWILRFGRNARLPVASREKGHVISNSEIAQAEKIWIRQAQREAFPQAEKDSSLVQLNPRKDSDGLLRLNGRLRLALELPYDTRYPIILPKTHAVTRLIVIDVHESLGHSSGVELVLTHLRSRYWIVKGRKTVRSTIETCPECRRRFSMKTANQMMAPLPRPRLESLRAFEKVGVDYGGPFLTRQGRGRTKAKRYLCLFTCLATRAVHLEMAYSLDSDSFINAFTRMVSRRGTPSYVISDNGTNFVGAERELRELVENLDKEKIARETTVHQQIEWKFNPASAPHFGGVFEALIKSAKKAIKAILGDADIGDEELHTAICGAEELINSRPITYVSADPNDLTPLTPNHFIVGQIGGRFAPEVLQEEDYNPVKRWHRVQQLLKLFWKRWRKEFLPSLNVRKKWFHPKHNLKPGDVVLIAEPKANRGEWPLGRILEVYQGSDGLVRVVKVKSKGKEYFRPVHRLCPLEYVAE